MNGHFTITVSEETAYSADYEPGQIIKQDPEGGTSTKSEIDRHHGYPVRRGR